MVIAQSRLLSRSLKFSFLSQSIFFNTATIFSSKRQLACFLRYAARAVCCLEKAVLEKQRFFFFPPSVHWLEEQYNALQERIQKSATVPRHQVSPKSSMRKLTLRHFSDFWVYLYSSHFKIFVNDLQELPSIFKKKDVLRWLCHSRDQICLLKISKKRWPRPQQT